MTTPTERQAILTQVARMADVSLRQLWSRVSDLSDDQFAAYLISAFPELVDPYAALAAELATEWYGESPSITDYAPKPGPLPETVQLLGSAQWALGASGTDAIKRLSGSMQRAIYDSARETTIFNSDYEPGSRWVRYASANACAFCALLSTRNKVYASKQSALRVVGHGKDFSSNYNPDGTRKSGGQAGGVKTRGSRKIGEKYHDHCHCVAVEVRPGGSYEPPPHVKSFEESYKDAFGAVPDGMAYDENNSVLKAVLSNMRTDLGSH